jgi:multidrug efflux pump subunit AcrB
MDKKFECKSTVESHNMNIAEKAIRYKVITLFATFLILGAGLFSYEKLGRLEDPEFTVKDAQIITNYPGASPQEVEEEVTEKVETAIQELGQIKEIESESKAGVSTVTVTIQDKYDKHSLPQVWDELRRKINDVQSKLPPGVKPSLVIDDYGDVFGMMAALSGKGFTYKELYDYADFLRREILLVPDVAKVTIWGNQTEEIDVEIARSRMTQLGINLNDIYHALKTQNIVVPSGDVKVGSEYIRIKPTGAIDSVDKISNLVIRSPKSDRLIYLKDIATVKRTYVSPPTQHLLFNGERALGIGISTVSGGNVVTMGKAVVERIKQLSPQLPLGLKLKYIYYQGEIVEKSVSGFVVNLMQAIAIVIVVLMIFMGLRSGLLIGTILLITVASTMVLMYIYAINLERISLGALIIALGMLVDNAIVVTEGILIRLQQGSKRIEAARDVVSQTMWPLLGATIVAILAFAAIGMSNDSTGEYLRSLFQVMLISLGMSWIIAITVTPLFCVLFLPKADVSSGAEVVDPYQGFLYTFYRGILDICLKLRWLTVAVVAGLLALAMVGFGQLEDSFFPDSTSQQFMVHFWLPQGTDIRETSRMTQLLQAQIKKNENVTEVASFIGAGAPRFMLVYSPEKANNSYTFLLVKVKDYRRIDELTDKLKAYVAKNYINAQVRTEKIRLGPGGGYPIEARFIGKEPNELRRLSEKAKQIMRDNPRSGMIRDDWRERVKIVEPEFSEVLARRAGITREDVANAIQTTFGGLMIGVYREDDKLLPIVSKRPKHESDSVNNLVNIQVFSPLTNKMVPLRQVVTSFKTVYEDSLIQRRDKKRTVTAQTEAKVGNTSVLFNQIRPQIEAIPLPIGYELEWGGEYEDSNDAQTQLMANIPPTLIIMIFITVMLFNGFRQPIIIWLTVPLAIIGVTFGLLVTNESFGFMALLGFLSLSGMLIKNSIVLLDEIEIQKATDMDPGEAIRVAAVSRLRPVMMAAITTILGMAPLLGDVFFFGMAVTIMFGLAFASVLTLIFVPVMYGILFRIS